MPTPQDWVIYLLEVPYYEQAKLWLLEDEHEQVEGSLAVSIPA